MSSGWGAAERARGRLLDSSLSSSSSSSSKVDRFTQEQRSREAKKAEMTVAPNQLAA